MPLCLQAMQAWESFSSNSAKIPICSDLALSKVLVSAAEICLLLVGMFLNLTFPPVCPIKRHGPPPDFRLPGRRCSFCPAGTLSELLRMKLQNRIWKRKQVLRIARKMLRCSLFSFNPWLSFSEPQGISWESPLEEMEKACVVQNLSRDKERSSLVWN